MTKCQDMQVFRNMRNEKKKYEEWLWRQCLAFFYWKEEF